MTFPSLEALEGSARGVSHHSSPTGLTLPSEKASERLPHHHLGPDAAGSKTQAHNGAVFWAPATSPSPRVHLRGRRKLFSKEAQDKQRLSPAPSWPHHGTHSTANSPPWGERHQGARSVPRPSSPTCSPLLPASFQGGASILMPAG